MTEKTVVRLDRFLANEGCGSRAEVKKMIRSGRIMVNGLTVRQGDVKIDIDKDEVVADGRSVIRAEVPTLMLNKPCGVVSATSDNYNKTVIDLIHEPWAGRLFPVGRLDIDTEGLLLLTSDGVMSHNLLSPKKHVVKTYYAVINGGPDPHIAECFMKGLDIGDEKKTLPARLIFTQDFLSFHDGLKPSDGLMSSDSLMFSDALNISVSGQRFSDDIEDLVRSEELSGLGENECGVLIMITEGRFHQVKRMFSAVGREVLRLKRLGMGYLTLDKQLAPGQYRPLTAGEMELLKGC